MFDIKTDDYEKLLTDEEELLRFASRYLDQVLFGVKTIPLRERAAAKRASRYRERLAARSAISAEEKTRRQDELYESLLDNDRRND